MYWKTKVIKDDGRKVECLIKQTCDTRKKAMGFRYVGWKPCGDFLIKGTNELDIGDFITFDITGLEEYLDVYYGMPREIPLLVQSHSDQYYDLYDCVVILPDYKEKLQKKLDEYRDKRYLVENTLECMIILNHDSNAKLVSDDEELQNRIDLYNKMKYKNVAIFLSPTPKEYKEMWNAIKKKDRQN